MNRDELINAIIDGMDLKTMWSVLDDYMHESYSKYTDEELIEEVKESQCGDLKDYTTRTFGRIMLLTSKVSL